MTEKTIIQRKENYSDVKKLFNAIDDEDAEITLNVPAKIQIANETSPFLTHPHLKLHKDSELYFADKRLRQTAQDHEQYKHIFCLGH